MSTSVLLALLLVALFTIANAATKAPLSVLEPFDAPITPPIQSTYVHPLLSTINYATATNVQAVQPGQLNYFNFSRPEGTREFYLYVPTTYSNATAWPFTFYFHGYSANWRQGVSLNQTVDAEAAGYLIAFGQGTLSSNNLLGWNGGVCCLFNATSIVDDVEFTRTALRIIHSAVRVDPSRVYTTGWSNGGYMSERLACEAGELFAGVCADASAVGILPGGLAGLASCDKSFGNKRLNYLHFHVRATHKQHQPRPLPVSRVMQLTLCFPLLPFSVSIRELPTLRCLGPAPATPTAPTAPRPHSATSAAGHDASAARPCRTKPTTTARSATCTGRTAGTGARLSL